GVQGLRGERGGGSVQMAGRRGARRRTRQPAEEDDTVEETEAAEGAGALRLPLLRGVIGSERPQRSEDERVAAARATAPAAGGLARGGGEKMQTALHDLTQCRRLLDAAPAARI